MIETVSRSMLAVNENLVIRKSVIKNGSGSKRLCFVTGTHGDELEGQYLAYVLGSFLRENINELDGCVEIYPALNPMGIDSVTRGIPDYDIDMNRAFPGTHDGTFVDAVCADIVNDIVGADICIDVHSSNIYLREIPQIRISVPTAENLLPYAKMLNVDFIWVHESATVLESTLAHSLNIRDTKTLVVEMGVGMRITKEYCFQLFDGILNLMKNIGMWSGEVGKVREPLVSMDGAVEFVNSGAAGIFVPCVSFGERIGKNTHIGDVLDPLSGKVVSAITSEDEGLIFTLREYPIVYGGSLLARILKK
ncbi:MAG: M14 family metallopeptidase [Firmicutes bacterium]|nr:M14 family metallopeptidase [[Eubacterium] siraeum]MCM1487439.1 M14 family metallopeptidase [Bacillota bacterium]